MSSWEADSSARSSIMAFWRIPPGVWGEAGSSDLSPCLGPWPLGTQTRTPTSHPGHPTGLTAPAHVSILLVLCSFPAAASRAVLSLALPVQLRHCAHLKPHRRLQLELPGEAWQCPARSHLPWCLAQQFGSARAQCPAPTEDARGLWALRAPPSPGVPSRAEHRARSIPTARQARGCIPRCSAPALRRDLAAEPRAGSAPRRRFPGPPGSPGSAGGTDGCGEEGMADSPPPSLNPPSSPPCPRCREGMSRSGCLRPPCC